MIEVSNLIKDYGGMRVLDGINITIPDGCIYGIVGRSGAGKSTLLRCLNGLETFSSGRIVVDGIDVGGLDEAEMRVLRRGMGMIFQNFALLQRRSVIENVMLPTVCWGLDGAASRARAEELLGMVGLRDRLNALPCELSGGQKQRVAIARALMLSPSVLLCDEATSALDPAITQSILEIITDINKNLSLTVVMVTHEMSVVREVCDFVAVIDGGKIMRSGTAEDVFLSGDADVKTLLGGAKITAPDGKRLVSVAVLGGGGETDAVCSAASSLGIRFSIMCADISRFHNGRCMGVMFLETACDDAERLAAELNLRGLRAAAGGEF